MGQEKQFCPALGNFIRVVTSSRRLVQRYAVDAVGACGTRRANSNNKNNSDNKRYPVCQRFAHTPPSH